MYWMDRTTYILVALAITVALGTTGYLVDGNPLDETVMNSVETDERTPNEPQTDESPPEEKPDDSVPPDDTSKDPEVEAEEDEVDPGICTSVGNQNDESPTGTRYVTAIESGERSHWQPEENVSLETDVPTYEVTRYPCTDPTPEQIDAAWELYNRTYEAAADTGLFDYENASEEGYRVHDYLHYFHEDHYLDEDNLNPHRPESLVYFTDFEEDIENVKDADDKTLAGVMYLADGIRSEGPEVGGPLTKWHYHPQATKECFRSRLNEGIDFEGFECEDGAEKAYRSPEMIHVWFVEAPEGPFSTEMPTTERATRVHREIEAGEGKPPKMSRSEFEEQLERNPTSYHDQKPE